MNRREQAYEEIIGAIHDVISYFRVYKEDYGQGTSLSDDGERELLDRYVAATCLLGKAADIGALYISESSIKILHELRSRRQHDYGNEPKFEFYDQECQCYTNALAALLKSAAQDLKRT